MFSILNQELRVFLKRKSTWILIALSILLTLFLVFYIVNTTTTSYQLNQDEVVRLKGIDAINSIVNKDAFEGYVNENQINKMNEEVKAIRAKYPNYGNIPYDVEDDLKRKYSYSNLYYMLGFGRNNMEHVSDDGYLIFEEDEVLNFYDNYKKNKLEKIIKDNNLQKSDYEYLQSLEDNIEKPFYYEETGSIWDDVIELFDILSIFMATIILTLFFDIFSKHHRYNEEKVLYATKNGRLKLTMAKLILANVGACIIYIVNTAIYFIPFLKICGTRGLKKSIQILDPVSLAPYNLSQMLLLVIFFSLMSILATTNFALFITTFNKDTVFNLIINYALLFLPNILIITGFAKKLNLIKGIKYIFPSSGLSMFYVMLNQYDIVSLTKPIYISPNIILVFLILNIILYTSFNLLNKKRYYL